VSKTALRQIDGQLHGALLAMDIAEATEVPEQVEDRLVLGQHERCEARDPLVPRPVSEG
jgi:hypothetical protein